MHCLIGVFPELSPLHEVALILFFVGLALLLWTVNFIIAALSTAIIGSILALVVFTAVLPVFLPRCPYKLPVGWACVRVGMTLSSLWALWGRCWSAVFWDAPRLSIRRRIVRRLMFTANVKHYSGWRARDAAIRDQMSTSPSLNATSLALRSSSIEIEGLKKELDKLRIAQVQIGYLSRMLRWTQEVSQDPRLLHIVDECRETRITKKSHVLALILVDFSFVSEQLGMEPGALCEDLDRLYSIIHDTHAVEHASLDRFWRDRNDSELWDRLQRLRRTCPRLLPQLARMLAHNIKQLIELMDTHRRLDRASAVFVMRLAALAAALMRSSWDWTCTQCLAPIFCHMLKEQYPCLPGLKTTLFELLRQNPRCILEYCEPLILHTGTLSDTMNTQPPIDLV